MNDQVKIVGNPLSNIPWENCAPESKKIVWRSAKNPIIPRDLIPKSNSIFNSAIIPHKNKFAGVFRVDHRSREMTLHDDDIPNESYLDLHYKIYLQMECDHYHLDGLTSHIFH